MRHSAVLLLAALLLALGVAGGGWLAGQGLVEARRADRFVTMKGLAERDVRADLAIWPLAFSRTGSDLPAVQAGLERDIAAASDFFERAGFPAEEIQPQPPLVTDLLAQPYRPEGAEQNRFIVAQTLLVRTSAVERMLAVSRRIGELVGQGVALGGGSPSYLFTGLNAIKPQMIAEATRSAREGAEQFAADSGSRVGAIREASQGLFVIGARDPVPSLAEDTQPDKRVRVVTTIAFFIEDGS